MNLYNELKQLVKDAPIKPIQKETLYKKIEEEIGTDTILPSNLIQGSFDFSNVEFACMCYMFSHFKEIDEYELYLDPNMRGEGIAPDVNITLKFSVAQLLKDFKMSSAGSNRTILRDSFKSLSDKSIWMRYLDKETGKMRQRTFRLFNKVDTETDLRTIKLFFDHEDFYIIKDSYEHYFSKLDFNQILQYDSRYTQRIFALVLSIMYKKNSFDATYKQLNRQLRTNYKPSQLEEKVINPAIKEIREKNDKSKIGFELEYKENGKEEKKPDDKFSLEIKQNIENTKILNQYIYEINKYIIENNSKETEETPLLLDYEELKKKDEEEKAKKKEISKNARELNEYLKELTKKDIKYDKYFREYLTEYPLKIETYKEILKFVSKKDYITPKYLEVIFDDFYCNDIDTPEEVNKKIEFLEKKAYNYIQNKKGNKKNIKNEEPTDWTRDYAFQSYYELSHLGKDFQVEWKSDKEMSEVWKKWKQEQKEKSR